MADDSGNSVTDEVWQQVVLAVADSAMQARDDAKPSRARTILDMYESSLQTRMIEARSVREAFGADLDKLAVRVLGHMDMGAVACFEFAQGATYVARATPEDDDDDTDKMCVFSLEGGAKGYHLVRNKPERSRQLFYFTPPWLAWVQSVMVVFNVFEWLEQVINGLLPPDLTVMTDATVQQLVDHKSIRKRLSTVNSARMVLFDWLQPQR